MRSPSPQRLAVLRGYALLLLSWASLCSAQDTPLSLVSDSTPTLATPTETIPEFEIEAVAKALQSEVHAGEGFEYQVTLSWPGKATWVSVETPKVSWPKEFRQVDVGAGVKSVAGGGGPRGAKSFKFTLIAEKAGSFRLPDISLKVHPSGKEEFTVEAPGVSIEVREPRRSARERFAALASGKGPIIAGALFVALAGIGVYLVQRTRAVPEVGPAPDPWQPIEAELKKVEAFIQAGENRDLYADLEALLRAVLHAALGSQERDLAALVRGLSVPDRLQQDIAGLADEIHERKFRPDRPRPEEMQSALKRFRAILRALREDSRMGEGIP